MEYFKIFERSGRKTVIVKPVILQVDANVTCFYYI